MPTLREAREQFEAKSTEADTFYKSFIKDGEMSMTKDDAKRFADLNAETTELGEQFKALKEVEEAARKLAAEREKVKPFDPKQALHTAPNGDSTHTETQASGHAKSMGELFVESEAYKSWDRAGSGKRKVDAHLPLDVINGIKATFTTAASTFTGYDRQPGMVLIEQQRLLVRDLLAMGETTQNTIRYPREDTYTNAATTVAEGATKPEATFDTSEADAPVRKIAVTAKVTDEMWADFPVIRDYINNRLRFMVLQTEEDQLLNGDGIAPNLTGLLNTSGIQTQAQGGDVAVDALYKAVTKIRTVGFFEPDGMVINAADWGTTAFRLAKDANQQYYGGGPFTGAYGNGSMMMIDRLWGLPVVVTTAIAAGTALVGAFKLGAQFFLRQGLTVETTNSNEDDFKKNLIAIRAEERGALAVYRPKAFCKVTGVA